MSDQHQNNKMSDQHQNKKTGRSRRVKRVKGHTIEVEVEEEEEERVQPDTIPSSISISAVAAARPTPVPSSSTVAAAPPRAGLTNPAPAQRPVAFVEKDLVVKQEPEEEDEARRVPQPETITSGDTSNVSHDPQQSTTTNQEDNNTNTNANTNNNRVMIKSEGSLANTNNNQKRKQGSIMPIKSEEVDNNDGAYSNKRTRRGKQRQYPSEEDSIYCGDSLNANTTKNRRVGGCARAGGGTASEHRRPKRTSLNQRQEEDSAQDETNCCRFCNDPSWESRIFYKCGTVISKYFPKSNNNPNPGWYKGTIRMHQISSSNSGSSSKSDSESEYEEEADGSIERESEQQSIILSEIQYEDGDVENIKQEDLKLQLMDSCKVKILHPTKMATASNSEQHNPVDVVAVVPSSDNKFDRNWLKIYHRLKQFKNENGHCRVPINYGPDPSLGNWVHNQRSRRGNMAEDRVKTLDEIGFDWDPFNHAWQEMFCRLERFNAENGHCHVPQRHDPDPLLGRWVSMQRQNYKKGSLAEDRVDKLEAIDFEWKPPNVRNRKTRNIAKKSEEIIRN